MRKAIPIIIICFFIVFIAGNTFIYYNSKTIQEDDSLGTIYLISHSHWDPWFHFNYKENMEIASGNIKGALDVISMHPDYRYTIDQMDVVKYFWETFPEYREKLMNAIENGKVEIVGGGVCEPDENIQQEEVLLENFLSGMRWLENTFGISVNVMWQTDVFGHTAEFPKIMDSLSIKYLYFHRAYNLSNGPHIWQAGDGSEILMWKFYYNHYHVDTLDFIKEVRKIVENAEEIDLVNPTNKIMWPLGCDHTPPTFNLPQWVDIWNTFYAKEMGYKIIISTPTEFFQALENDANYDKITTYRGDLNPIFSGALTTYIELKQHQRNIEHYLLSAERFGVINNLFTTNRYPEDQIQNLWWNATLYQHHDTITGTSHLLCVKDYWDMFSSLENNCSDLLDSQINQINAIINTSASDGNVTYVLYNSLAWDRREIIDIPIYLDSPGVKSVTAYNLNGTKIPLQISYIENHTADNSIKDAIISLDVSIPSLGFNCYYLKYNTTYEDPLPPGFIMPSVNIIDTAGTFKVETNVLNLTFSKAQGGDLISLIYNDTEYLNDSDSCSINVYKCSNSLYTTTPAEFLDKTGNIAISNITTLENGPLFGRFNISTEVLDFDFERIVTVYWNSSFVNFEINLDSEYPNAALVTQKIPITLQNLETRFGVQYGSLIHPEWKEDLKIGLPSMYWITGYNNSNGLGIVDYGLIGKRAFNSNIFIDLYHNSAADLGTNPIKVHNESKSVSLAFGLFPYEKKSKEIVSDVYLKGYEYNFPIYNKTISKHNGSLPFNFSLLSINDSRIILSRLKEIKGDLHLRVYNADNNETIPFSLALSDLIPETFQNFQKSDSRGISKENITYTQTGFNATLSSMSLQTFIIDRDYGFLDIQIESLIISVSHELFLDTHLDVSFTCSNATQIKLYYSYDRKNWDYIVMEKDGNIFSTHERVESKSMLYIKVVVIDTNGDQHTISFGSTKVHWDIFTNIFLNAIIGAIAVAIYLSLKRKFTPQREEDSNKTDAKFDNKLKKLQFYVLTFTTLFIFSNIMFSLLLFDTMDMFPYFNYETVYFQVWYIAQNGILLLFLLIGIVLILFLSSLIYILKWKTEFNSYVLLISFFIPILSIFYLALWAILKGSTEFLGLLLMEFKVYTQAFIVTGFFLGIILITCYFIYELQNKAFKSETRAFTHHPIITKGRLADIKNKINRNKKNKIIVSITALVITYILFYFIVGPALFTLEWGAFIQYRVLIYLILGLALAYLILYFSQAYDFLYSTVTSRILLMLGFVFLTFLFSFDPFFIFAIPAMFFSYDIWLFIVIFCFLVPFVLRFVGLVMKWFVGLVMKLLLKIKKTKEIPIKSNFRSKMIT
ncbi:MAG: hypothetical protein HWN65_18645 [Candidatus Helarchaeota archaeon]|nr:hypothetical protein [Candidatus Helarchaeota archaeon]